MCSEFFNFNLLRTISKYFAWCGNEIVLMGRWQDAGITASHDGFGVFIKFCRAWSASIRAIRDTTGISDGRSVSRDFAKLIGRIAAMAITIGSTFITATSTCSGASAGSNPKSIGKAVILRRRELNILLVFSRSKLLSGVNVDSCGSARGHVHTTSTTDLWSWGMGSLLIWKILSRWSRERGASVISRSCSWTPALRFSLWSSWTLCPRKEVEAHVSHFAALEAGVVLRWLQHPGSHMRPYWGMMPSLAHQQWSFLGLYYCLLSWLYSSLTIAELLASYRNDGRCCHLHRLC